MTFTDDLHAFFWMVGVLEGEGTMCFPPPSRPNQPYVKVEMTDRDVVARIARFWGVAVVRVAPRAHHHKPTYKATLSGQRAVALMRDIAPYMSERRREKIEQILWARTITHDAARAVPRPAARRRRAAA